MKKKLEALGWTCRPCSCPGAKGFDCAHRKFAGVVIQDRGNRFKIIKNSAVIESAFAYELDEKMKANELL